ncbi:hypothetical protein TNCT_689281 [Trichonephila clavata]|uniref:Uncharacterized protein n=1 Tax=Trichonephila clavata TaxID=2740835 RepID=A0A8X6FA65_TRICU|nr:hypothetical protein TNCT_689281 [Trichonephila clavata]
MSDINETIQLAVFISGVDNQRNVAEELLQFLNLKGATIGRDIKDAVINCTQSRQIYLKNLVDIAADGAHSMFEKIMVLLH